MTIENKDVEAISAWLDGELSAEDRDRTAERLRDDEGLSEVERDMRHVDISYKQAMREALPPPSLASVRTIKSGFAKRQKTESRQKLIRMALPVAASLLVVAGTAMWVQTEFRKQETEQRVAIAQLVDSAVQNALETAISGNEVAFNLPNARFVTITPVRTYRSVSNHWCREFTEQIVVDGETVTRQGTACRRADGGWDRIEPTTAKSVASDT